jgi:hypothetical protein
VAAARAPRPRRHLVHDDVVDAARARRAVLTARRAPGPRAQRPPSHRVDRPGPRAPRSPRHQWTAQGRVHHAPYVIGCHVMQLIKVQNVEEDVTGGGECGMWRRMWQGSRGGCGRIDRPSPTCTYSLPYLAPNCARAAPAARGHRTPLTTSYVYMWIETRGFETRWITWREEGQCGGTPTQLRELRGALGGVDDRGDGRCVGPGT